MFVGAGDEGGEPASNQRASAKRAKDDGPPEDYDEDEELREGKLRFTGGRGEAATYDAPDEVRLVFK
jgi:DNA-directed RNA polymerase I subunit RPA1